MRECVRISDEALAAVAENGALEELDCSLVPAVATATAVALTAYCKCTPSLLLPVPRRGPSPWASRPALTSSRAMQVSLAGLA